MDQATACEKMRMRFVFSFKASTTIVCAVFVREEIAYECTKKQ
jgi:hypothetical protein